MRRKYSVGQRVVVVKPKDVVTKAHGGGFWWTASMDKHIGKEYKIILVDDRGYKLGLPRDQDRYGWNEEWLIDPMIAFLNEVTK